MATSDGETFAARAFYTERPDPIDLSHVATTAFLLPALAQVGTLEAGQTGQSLSAMETPLWHHDTDPQDFHKITTRDGSLTGAVLIQEAAEMIARWAH